jgi:alkanesulfonate monooxygenase SsuD/methylene tetrahydromethanopterin reductase-like flavin-dependent oxidoreductase (luciferase family)
MSERGTMPGDVAAAARHAEELGFESVWVIDQLVAGTGVPLLDSGIALATAAAATSRVGLGYGVLVVPLHPLVWLAKQVASLQHVSGGRLILGVGTGGDRHRDATSLRCATSARILPLLRSTSSSTFGMNASISRGLPVFASGSPPASLTAT